MTINEFTKDEIEYLRSLRAVSKVTNGRIRYTEEFKRDCMRRYSEGEAPIKIFRDAGLDPVLIGYKRIERCISRWKETEATDDSSRGGVRRCMMAALRSMRAGMRSHRSCA